MTWKNYEIEIYDIFKAAYPTAQITFNAIIIGRYSKVERQIDILIEDYIAGNRMRIIVDGKYFSKRIDVKCVENYIGMLNDCEANKGLLITQEGYSKAAINRAFHDPIDIELDILNFKQLKQFQGLGGIIVSGNHGAIFPAPFGWIIDGTNRENLMGVMFQRGLTLEQAAKNNEWMYTKIFSKNNDINTLDQLLSFHEIGAKATYSDYKVSFIPTIIRQNFNVRIRVIESAKIPTKEYTGFVEFQDFIFFCVLFTPEELKKKNIRKLESILLQVIPLNVTNNSEIN